jgi:hypothetical protein
VGVAWGRHHCGHVARGRISDRRWMEKSAPRKRGRHERSGHQLPAIRIMPVEACFVVPTSLRLGSRSCCRIAALAEKAHLADPSEDQLGCYPFRAAHCLSRIGHADPCSLSGQFHDLFRSHSLAGDVSVELQFREQSAYGVGFDSEVLSELILRGCALLLKVDECPNGLQP